MSGSVVVIVVICRFGCVENWKCLLCSQSMLFLPYEVAVLLNRYRLGVESLEKVFALMSMNVVFAVALRC